MATALSGPVAVIAGAGTGKTRAITHRIAYGVATGAYNPTSVLAVTFTTRAAGELRGRLQQLGAHGVQARTFHSAALRQAQYFWPKAYGGELPGVLDNRMSLVAEAASRLRIRVDTPKLRDLVAEIAWAKVSNVNPEDYPAPRRTPPPQCRLVRTRDGRADLRRLRAGQTRPLPDRLRGHPALRRGAALGASGGRGHHPPHLPASGRRRVPGRQPAAGSVAKPVARRPTDLCVVGDPAQTIHSFAGAQAHFLTGFAGRFPGATVVELVRDYRSTPQVVGCANAVSGRRLRRGNPAGPAAGGT